MGIVAGILVGGLLLFLILCSNGVFNNYLSKSGRRAGPNFKIGGNSCFVVAGILAWLMANGTLEAQIGYILGVFALLVLGVCVNCGFNFTIDE